MTLAVSILAALLLISLVLLADQWIRKQALIAYLAIKKISMPSDEEWAKCMEIVARMIFRRKK